MQKYVNMVITQNLKCTNDTDKANGNQYIIFLSIGV